MAVPHLAVRTVRLTVHTREYAVGGLQFRAGSVRRPPIASCDRHGDRSVVVALAGIGVAVAVGVGTGVAVVSPEVSRRRGEVI